MRKAKTIAADELRSEYKRSDFGALVSGKIHRAAPSEFQRRRHCAGGCRTVSERGCRQRCVAVLGRDCQAC
jgi:hypothetical protein